MTSAVFRSPIIPPAAPSPAPPAFLERLRRATAPAHEKLEQRLDLLHRPPGHDDLLALLRGFHGFHAVWEPQVEAELGAAYFLPRRRLPLLQADLEALGDPGGPPPRPVLDLFDSAPGAWGSAYVLEGSTLGGALIARALAGREGLPARLRYFSPHGRRTAAMWAAFRADMLRSVPPEAEALAIASAQATFQALAGWLPENRRT
ncbi:biliverdin-producing heme oxygenase [Geminicoccus roseus]|uniref:biliverdin-producing heme oxygenase n=1 Tax=Geminicoccus roseus TaxID=404900 RepID=UPI000426DA81|nr:biliverdin-producing heme oxygenase [Geminicoccus roseus]